MYGVVAIALQPVGEEEQILMNARDGRADQPPWLAMVGVSKTGCRLRVPHHGGCTISHNSSPNAWKKCPGSSSDHKYL